MPRRSKNQLRARTLPNGSLQLFGEVLGKQIRERFRGPDAHLDLAARRRELESKLAAASGALVQRGTWMSEAQLRAAEAATLHAQGRWSLLQCVLLMEKQPPDFVPLPRAEALKAWLHHLRVKLKRYPRTLESNERIVTALFKTCAFDLVHEITPAVVQDFVLAAGIGGRTQIKRGMTVRAFGAFCVRELRCLPVNFMLVNLKSIRVVTERPRILTPEQCGALLQAAVDRPGARLVPFVVLTTWCFLRRAEAENLDVADIDLARARVTVDPRKLFHNRGGTESLRRVTIPPNALLVLQWCRQKDLLPEKGPVWFHEDELDAVREAAGLIERAPAAKRGGHRKIVASQWQEHISRHSGLSYLYQQTGDIKEVTRQAGNSRGAAFASYIDLPKEGDADRFYNFLPKVAGVNFDLAGALAEARKRAASMGGKAKTPAKLAQLKAALAKRWALPESKD